MWGGEQGRDLCQGPALHLLDQADRQQLIIEAHAASNQRDPGQMTMQLLTNEFMVRRPCSFQLLTKETLVSRSEGTMLSLASDHIESDQQIRQVLQLLNSVQ